jgi:alpha-glucosidase
VSEPWWRTAVLYQVYVRSFADGDGDGIGDLAGLRAHLDDLVELGVDALWLCPIHPSPRADGGYDVTDYQDVAPEYGDLAGFDALLADAHARGLRILLDWVPNHTSDRHPWFLEAAADRGSPRRHWYVWRDGGGPEHPPNGWTAAWGGPAWTWHAGTGQWYLSSFTPHQPELDWRNPAVEEAMLAGLRFWLERGVDGFRVDVVHMLGKDPEGPELPDGPTPMVHYDPAAHAVVRRLRTALAAHPDAVLLGEVSIMDTAVAARFLDGGAGLHLAFDFCPMFAPWDAGAWWRCLSAVLSHITWATWTFANHDNPRAATRYHSVRRARAVAAALLTLRGTPVLYAGEELGLADALVPAEAGEDPAGRDGCRAPLPWLATDGHGWGPTPWMVHPPDAAGLAHDVQRADARSAWTLHRDLLAVRRSASALSRGDMRLLPAAPGLVGWFRGADEWLVIVGFAGGTWAGTWTLEPEHWIVVVEAAGRQGEGRVWNGRVPADTTLVLRRCRGDESVKSLQ